MYTGMLLRIPAVEHGANEFGFRGPAVPPGEGTRPRIIMIGDSYTYGQGVSASDALPSALQDVLGGDVDVLNFGVPGLNAEEAREQFAHFARRWAPDLVVFNLYSNDLDAGICDLLGSRTFDWFVHEVRAFRLAVVLFAPRLLGGPEPALTPARRERLAEEVRAFASLVEADGSAFAVLGLGDPLHDTSATTDVLEQTGVEFHLLDQEFASSLEALPREGHWTEGAQRRVAERIAPWVRRVLEAHLGTVAPEPPLEPW